MPTSPSSEAPEAWSVHFFQRHMEDDLARSVPAHDFLDACPPSVRTRILAVVKAVAEAPPPSFGGGGKWEAMHGDMAGIYEVRVDGPKRHHFRLFCVLEKDGAKLGLGGPSVVLLTGKNKPFRTKLPKKAYTEVRQLRDEYQARSPRSVSK